MYIYIHIYTYICICISIIYIYIVVSGNQVLTRQRQRGNTIKEHVLACSVKAPTRACAATGTALLLASRFSKPTVTASTNSRGHLACPKHIEIETHRNTRSKIGKNSQNSSMSSSGLPHLDEGLHSCHAFTFATPGHKLAPANHLATNGKYCRCNQCILCIVCTSGHFPTFA